MRKQDFSGKAPKLLDDMRGWSDGGRGSVAIKAHSDVIVCQERKMVKDEEVVYIGAFMKDGPDVNPMAMKESDGLSFFWQVVPDVSAHLWPSFEALRKAGGQFTDKGAAVRVLQSTKTPKATASKPSRRWWKEFVPLSEQVDTSTPRGKMVFTVLGAVAELERSLIAERVKSGLRNARAKGKKLGGGHGRQWIAPK